MTVVVAAVGSRPYLAPCFALERVMHGRLMAAALWAAAVFGLMPGCNTVGVTPAPWEEDNGPEPDIWTGARSDALEAAPTVQFYGGPTAGVAPLQVYLDGTRSKAANDGSWIANCRIDFGDGESSTACWALHTYPAGEWMARFTATDNRGRTASAQMVITASGPSTPVDAGTTVPPPSGPGDAGSTPPPGSADAGSAPPPSDPPSTELRWYAGREGVAWARSVSADEGGVLWAVNDTSILSLSPGATRFQVHSGVGQLARGDWPYTICGGGPNQAYVGYVAPEDIPTEGGTPAQWLRGDLDRVVLDSPSVLRVEHHYSIVNTNDARYDEVRTIVACVRQNNRALKDYGTLYVGSNHAVTRIQGNDYADHRHIVFSKPSGSLVIGYNWAVSLKPDGDLFFANDFKLGILKPTDRLQDWLSFSINPWVMDTYAPVMGSLEEADKWHAAAVTPDGKHWLGSWGKGLMWMTPSPRRYTVVENTPDPQINALAAEADSTLWVGTQNHGLYRLRGSTWSKFATPSSRIFGLYLDTRTQPAHALHRFGSRDRRLPRQLTPRRFRKGSAGPHAHRATQLGHLRHLERLRRR
ncbi:MAG: hypothetical protein ACT4TC_01055 [Myxococcaceae bacterium]